jgi:hypothetical protein
MVDKDMDMDMESDMLEKVLALKVESVPGRDSSMLFVCIFRWVKLVMQDQGQAEKELSITVLHGRGSTPPCYLCRSEQ